MTILPSMEEYNHPMLVITYLSHLMESIYLKNIVAMDTKWDITPMLLMGTISQVDMRVDQNTTRMLREDNKHIQDSSSNKVAHHRNNSNRTGNTMDSYHMEYSMAIRPTEHPILTGTTHRTAQHTKECTCPLLQLLKLNSALQYIRME